MAVVKIFTPPNTLAQVLGGPGDPMAACLVRDAAGRVCQLAAGIREDVRARCRTITRLADAPETEVFACSQEIDAEALAICEVAGAAGLNATGEAARGIHAMLDALSRHGVWHTEALKLHTDALMLFNADRPPGEAETRTILARLKAMRAWVGVPE